METFKLVGAILGTLSFIAIFAVATFICWPDPAEPVIGREYEDI